MPREETYSRSWWITMAEALDGEMHDGMLQEDLKTLWGFVDKIEDACNYKGHNDLVTIQIDDSEAVFFDKHATVRNTPSNPVQSAQTP